MPYCPNCGKVVEDGMKFCGSCGYELSGKEQKDEVRKEESKEEKKFEEAPSKPATESTDPISAIRGGLRIISAKPIVLLPALIGAVISAVLSLITALFFIPLGIWNLAFLTSALIGLMFIGAVLSLIGGVISYILAFASLDMARNAYLNKELNLGASVGYVIKRILTFIVASIVGALLAITIVLIPLVAVMFVIMVVDEVGLGESLSRAFKFLGDRLSDIIILFIIGIVGGVILGLIPYIGSILAAAFNVLIALAYIDVYLHYKRI
ncbi:MAG: Zinc-ribbon protein [Thermoproteota archaeon]|nr:Zinc-ribbon protein [Thermoproteota archaeon]